MRLLVTVATLLLFLPPSRAKEKDAVASLEIHPKVFHLIDCWVSDSEAPVVTEINLDAVKADTNQFDPGSVKKEEGWVRCDDSESHGFFRYRVLEAKEGRYKVEYQENGGGSLTTACFIGFVVEKREIKKDGKAFTLSVLKVLSFAAK